MADNVNDTLNDNLEDDIDVSSIQLDDLSRGGGSRSSRNFKDLERKPEVLDEDDYARASRQVAAQPVSKGYDYYDNPKPILPKILLIVGILAVIYAIMFFSSTSGRKKLEATLSKELSNATYSEAIDTSAASNSNGLSIGEKLDLGLSYFLIDSDNDGLSDLYEINVTKTNPVKADSDVDAVKDGLEVLIGFDPLNKMSDGSTEDGKRVTERVITSGIAAVTINDKATSLGAYFDRLDNNSIKGRLGIIGDVYEFYSDSVISGTTITFTLTSDYIKQRNLCFQNLSVTRFDSEAKAFIPLESRLDAENYTVTADVTENGVYALSDGNIISQPFETRIIFLIDNSGSMYPEEMCTNSEENDVEFKRVDFAIDFIENFKAENIKFGVSKFTATYNALCPVTENKKDVIAGIERIKTESEHFNGTEIAGSIISLAKEIPSGENSKNYVILITDGMSSSISEKKEQEVDRLCNEKNITVFTVGLGKEVNAEYLRNIADRTNGSYFQAANAEALDGIYAKIQDYMSYNTVVITDSSDSGEAETAPVEKNAYILADCGFNVAKDCIPYKAFSMSEDTKNSYFGIAEFVKRYYTGTLESTAPKYMTRSGEMIDSYDISSVPTLLDKKADLKGIRIDGLDVYEKFNGLSDKWDFRKTGDDGVLRLSTSALAVVSEMGLSVTELPYDGEGIKQGGFASFVSKITFNEMKPFSIYEDIYIGKGYRGDSAGFFDMINYYEHIHDSGMVQVYDFASNGKEAMEILADRMSQGEPVVLSFGDKAVNAVRLLKEADDPLKYVIEVYDSDYPGEIKRIKLDKVIVHDGSDDIKFQFVAKYESQTDRLCLYNK